MKKFSKVLLLICLTIIPFNVGAINKQESVYEVLNKDGSRKSISVSSKLTFVKNNDIIDDTELRNILNISGDEQFNLNRNKLVWKGNNKNIIYTGETNKETPIKTSIKYELNGQKIDVNELEGKEGDVKITINLTNTESRKVNGNKLYVPYVTTVGTSLDNNTEDISITNGKVVSTGEKNLLVAIAAPGLYESIGLKDLKDLNKVEIKYHTKSFEYKDIYLVSTPKLLSKTDMEVFNKMDKVTESAKKIQDNMNKIVSATSKLKEGSFKLNAALKQVNDGIIQLSDGSTKVSDGMDKAYDGLDKATKKLDDEINETSVNQLKQLKEKNRQTITKMTTDLTTAIGGGDIDQTYANLSQSGACSTEQYKSFCSNYQLLQLIKANYQSVDSELTLVTSLPKQLNELKKGLKEIKDGSKNISTNLKKVKTAIGTIYDGSTELNNGMNKLDNGVDKFNKQGINKLTNYSNKLDKYSKKAKALVQLSKDYEGFASSNADETVFITVIK